METKYVKVSCGICGFPKHLPEAPNSKFGEIVCMGRCTIECLKEHFLKYHPHEYKDLLKEINNLKSTSDLKKS